jgi:hypothetical protein
MCDCSECREKRRNDDALERVSKKALGYGLRHGVLFLLTGGVGNGILAAGEIISELQDAADTLS